MVRWIVEMYNEVTGDYKFMRCGGSDREKYWLNSSRKREKKI